MKKSWILLLTILVLLIVQSSSVLALTYYNNDVVAVMRPQIDKMMIAIRDCDPVGVERIVFYGRITRDYDGWSRDGRISLYHVNYYKSPQELTYLWQLLGHEIAESQGVYDHDGVSVHDYDEVMKGWQKVSCRGNMEYG